jgi:hypothetical protein
VTKPTVRTGLGCNIYLLHTDLERHWSAFSEYSFDMNHFLARENGSSYIPWFIGTALGTLRRRAGVVGQH